jgi:hypothetical protein
MPAAWEDVAHIIDEALQVYVKDISTKRKRDSKRLASFAKLSKKVKLSLNNELAVV